MADKLYRPGNGTEGSSFHCAWCFQCERDINEDCDILARTFAFKVTDKEYPVEWCYGPDGQPQCTAFIYLGDRIPAPRCTRTIDMFVDAA